MENGGAFQYAFCLSLTALEALGGQSLCEAFSGCLVLLLAQSR